MARLIAGKLASASPAPPSWWRTAPAPARCWRPSTSPAPRRTAPRFLYASTSTLITPLVNRGTDLDPARDFAAVAMAQSSPLLMVSRPDFPAQDAGGADGLGAGAAGPLTVSHPGIGGINHLSMAMLTKQTGVEFTLVPYNGNSPSLTALVRGDVDLAGLASSPPQPAGPAAASAPIAITSAGPRRHAGGADLRRDGARLRGAVLGRPDGAARHARAGPRPPGAPRSTPCCACPMWWSG